MTDTAHRDRFVAAMLRRAEREQEIQRVVNAARMSETDRAVLMRRALAGESEARFVVYALSKRQEAK